jgi:hypothetical protein
VAWVSTVTECGRVKETSRVAIGEEPIVHASRLETRARRQGVSQRYIIHDDNGAARYVTADHAFIAGHMWEATHAAKS